MSNAGACLVEETMGKLLSSCPSLLGGRVPLSLITCASVPCYSSTSRSLTFLVPVSRPLSEAHSHSLPQMVPPTPPRHPVLSLRTSQLLSEHFSSPDDPPTRQCIFPLAPGCMSQRKSLPFPSGAHWNCIAIHVSLIREGRNNAVT